MRTLEAMQDDLACHPSTGMAIAGVVEGSAGKTKHRQTAGVAQVVRYDGQQMMGHQIEALGQQGQHHHRRTMIMEVKKARFDIHSNDPSLHRELEGP